MALNLSTLTSPATSGDVLAEVLTTADFLEPVPVLRNLARGSNKGGDAEQDVALNQPKALPLIDGDGYLYLSGVSGNYASVPDDESLDITSDITIDLDVTFKSWTPSSTQVLVSKMDLGSQKSFMLQLETNGKIRLYLSQDGTAAPNALSSVSVGFAQNTRAILRVSWNNTTNDCDFFTSLDGGVTFNQLGDTQTLNITSIFSSSETLFIGKRGSAYSTAAIHSVKFYDSVTPSSNSLRFNCDFTATNVRHGDTKFKCATGQVVTINQDSSSSNDVATIIKKPVLRFDGANDSLQGLFGQTVTGGYMFAAFSVLGDGGTSFGRVFGINSTGSQDNVNTGYLFGVKDGLSNNLRSFYNGTFTPNHTGLFDDSNVDILHEVKVVDGTQIYKVNNADIKTSSFNLSSLSSEEFSIAARPFGDNNTAIDLEYLALFPASLTDAQADAVRNYINNRNKVFDLKDGFGYYFYNPQDLSSGAVTSWNGRIVGSDNGDSDKLATQATAADQPTSDGYKVTFADATDHLEIPSTTQAGWQVVGTSLGTFVYKVNANAVTELTMLGNAGTYRAFGDLYGIMLLPESATNRDIEEARKLLIDRGAESVGQTATAAWSGRSDVIEFKNTNFTDALYLNYSWDGCTNMTQIGSVNAPLSLLFTSAWRNCSSLTSFPADAKLGTEATNVNFTQAWRSSGLTSFPALDLSTGNNFTSAWQSCSALTSFPADAKLGTEASNVNFSNAWNASGLTSFSTPLPTATSVISAWQLCTSLTSFNTDLPLVTSANQAWYGCSSLTSFSSSLSSAKSMYQTWRYCSSLTDFSADVFANWNPSSITSGVFNFTWSNCTSLTAQSVENILTSIDASGKYATSNGASGSTAITDAGIDIDYDGSGLTAATTAAITSLKSKGWSIFINSVEQ